HHWWPIPPRLGRTDAMKWAYRAGVGLAALFTWAVGAAAQEVPATPVPPPPIASPGPMPPPDAGPAEARTGLGAESRPGAISESSQAPSGFRLGPTPVSEVNFLMDYLRLRDLFGDTGIRSFGWVEGGYTGASPGAGILSVETRQNRFGNNFLLNQIGLTVQK